MTGHAMEQAAVRNLANQGIRAFAPFHQTTHRHARKFKTVLMPVFPGYLFVILDLGRDRWRSVNGTFGVRQLIMGGERPEPVTRGIVETLIQSTDSGGVLVFRPQLEVGDTVRLLSGPFADQLGVLQRLNAAGRVEILLNILGGMNKIATHRDSVAIVDKLNDNKI